MKNSTDRPRLDLISYLHAALVPLIPLGLGFALLLAFKYEVGGDLHDAVRVIGVILIWFFFSVSANQILEIPERAKAREEELRRSAFLSRNPGVARQASPGVTGKAIWPEDR